MSIHQSDQIAEGGVGRRVGWINNEVSMVDAPIEEVVARMLKKGSESGWRCWSSGSGSSATRRRSGPTSARLGGHGSGAVC